MRRRVDGANPNPVHIISLLWYTYKNQKEQDQRGSSTLLLLMLLAINAIRMDVDTIINGLDETELGFIKSFFKRVKQRYQRKMSVATHEQNNQIGEPVLPISPEVSIPFLEGLIRVANVTDLPTAIELDNELKEHHFLEKIKQGALRALEQSRLNFTAATQASHLSEQDQKEPVESAHQLIKKGLEKLKLELKNLEKQLRQAKNEREPDETEITSIQEEKDRKELEVIIKQGEIAKLEFSTNKPRNFTNLMGNFEDILKINAESTLKRFINSTKSSEIKELLRDFYCYAWITDHIGKEAAQQFAQDHQKNDAWLRKKKQEIATDEQKTNSSHSENLSSVVQLLGEVQNGFATVSNLLVKENISEEDINEVRQKIETVEKQFNKNKSNPEFLGINNNWIARAWEYLTWVFAYCVHFLQGKGELKYTTYLRTHYFNLSRNTSEAFSSLQQTFFKVNASPQSPAIITAPPEPPNTAQCSA